MSETPLSGRIVWYFHRRYIENRRKTGTDTEHSSSMAVLVPIENKGVLLGFHDAWIVFSTQFNVELSEYNTEWYENIVIRKALFTVVFFTGMAEFFAISLGIRLDSINKNGHWRWLSVSRKGGERE